MTTATKPQRRLEMALSYLRCATEEDTPAVILERMLGASFQIAEAAKTLDEGYVAFSESLEDIGER